MTASFIPTRALGVASLAALLASTALVHAQSLNLGSVTAAGSSDTTSDAAIGDKAAKGTAPNAAPSQAPLSAAEPVAVISQKTIRETLPASSDFASTITSAPSVVVNSPNGIGNGEATGITLRGFSDGQFNVTMDGIPFGDTNDFTHHSTAYFPADILSAVSVDRGPGYASTIGEATFGGTVALHSLDTEDHFGGTITAGYGSFDTRHLGVQLQSGAINPTGTRLALSIERNVSNGATTLGKAANNNITIKISQPIGDRFLLTEFSSIQTSKYNNLNQISGAQEEAYGKDYANLSNDPNSQQWVGANRTTKTTDFHYLAIAGDAGLFQIEDKIYTYGYDNHEKDSNNPQTPSSALAGDPGGTIWGTEADAKGYGKLNRYRSFGDILKLSRDIDAGVASGTFRTGVWIEHQNNDRYVHWWDYNTNTSYKGKHGLYYKYKVNSKIDTVQPYLEYAWTPVNNLTITPGVKFVSFRRHQGGLNQGTYSQIDYTAHYHTVLPYLSANYRLTPNLAVYAQYAKGFLAPNVNVLYVTNPSSNSVGPQKTTNYQIGAVYKSGNLTADADGYYIDFNNYITPSGNGQYYINSGAVIYKGLEGEATYVLGHGLNLFGSGSINSANLSAYAKSALGESAVPLAPHWIADFGPTYDNGTFFGSFLTKYVGPTADSTGTWWVKTYDTSNLIGGVHLGAIVPKLKDVKISLGIYNLLDHRNILDETASLNGNGSLNFAASTFDYLAPRSVYATVAASF